MKHLANSITTIRIVAAIAMIFTAPLSMPFFIFYAVGGISDMIDGTVARKLGTQSHLGARLDSVADLFFLISAAIKLLPTLWNIVPIWAMWVVAVIVAVKLLSAVIGMIRFHKLTFLHTYLNKSAGAAVFLLPFFYSDFFTALIGAACGIAFLAAIEEFVCTLRIKEYNPEIESIFHII